MKKNLMIFVFAISFFQSISTEDCNDSLIFEDYKTVVSIEVTEAKQQHVSVWNALKVAPRYVYETHLKSNFKAMIALLFKTTEEVPLEE